MLKHGTTSQTSGSYIEFQAAVLRALPRDIAPEIQRQWTSNGESLSRVLRQALVSTGIIDCDTDPFMPKGWTVKEHKKGGQIKWGSKKVMLHLSKKQHGSKVIGGHDLRQELENRLVLNANVLDYLLTNPHLIPKEWRGSHVFFWGTVYRDPGGDLCVRCLRWGDGRWGWSDRWLDRDWDDDAPAAVFAS